MVESEPEIETKPKSKNALKKTAKLERRRKLRLEKRKFKKNQANKRKIQIESEENDSKEHVSKRVKKYEVREKLQKAQLNKDQAHLRICIDLQFESYMSEKELVHLARQLSRIYGSNKTLDNSAQVFLTNIQEESKSFKVCCDKNDGFANYIWNRTEQSLLEKFANERSDLVYLTPDSPNLLSKVSKDKVYVIGGLIDDSVKKHTSFNFAKENEIATAKLPISEHCDKSGEGGTFKQILTINQVFEILTTVSESGNWKEAFEKSLPKRTGFTQKQ